MCLSLSLLFVPSLAGREGGRGPIAVSPGGLWAPDPQPPEMKASEKPKPGEAPVSSTSPSPGQALPSLPDLPRTGVFGCAHHPEAGVSLSATAGLGSGDHRHLDQVTFNNPNVLFRDKAKVDYEVDLLKPAAIVLRLLGVEQGRLQQHFDRIHCEWLESKVVQRLEPFLAAYMLLKKGGILTVDGFQLGTGMAWRVGQEGGLGYQINVHWRKGERWIPTHCGTLEAFKYFLANCGYNIQVPDDSVAVYYGFLKRYRAASGIDSLPLTTPFGWPGGMLPGSRSEGYFNLDQVTGDDNASVRAQLEMTVTQFFEAIGFGQVKFHYDETLAINGRTGQYWLEATKR